MRILIISDSHGRTENIEMLRGKIGKIDLILHCGDGTSEFDYIRSCLGAQITGVSGNCDLFTQERDAVNLNIEGKIIHIEHGHRLPYFSDTAMMDFAIDNGYDVVLFGHTHMQKLIEKDGRYVVNPGSISRPRDGFASYVILETDGHGNMKFKCERL
ncbi:MAG: YfcE family phosphodiesterase [Lachnospiraceae bacterium]|nr:YfcE family phosphodiesterase [Lachnospiraceae bacterium]